MCFISIILGFQKHIKLIPMFTHLLLPKSSMPFPIKRICTCKMTPTTLHPTSHLIHQSFVNGVRQPHTCWSFETDIAQKQDVRTLPDIVALLSSKEKFVLLAWVFKWAKPGLFLFISFPFMVGIGTRRNGSTMSIRNFL